jgi:hypothetical protein
MANPYTAKNTMVSSEAVNTFLTAILLPNDTAKPTRFTSTFVSRGAFGVVFHIDVDINIENPFETFYVTDEQELIIITSSNTQFHATGPYMHRFCCKIVFINTEEDEFSFTNECVKQKDIYARTNQNLNSVCLPLFFYSIVSKEPNTNLLYLFITKIFASHPDKYTPSIKLGISFMPYSMNNLLPLSESTVQQILRSESLLPSINSVMREPVEINESRVIHIFKYNLNIYSFCIVLSLVIRLFFAGYCHGDLHLGNIIGYPYPSGMHVTTREFFKPMILLIDTGFAFRHLLDIHALNLNSYDHFKSVINNIMLTHTPRTGETMINNGPFYWFSQIFMDGIGGDVPPTLNEDRCKLMFHLFQYFELYRSNFETHQLDHLKRLVSKDDLDNLNVQSPQVIAIVNTYIEDKLPLYNLHGGRRRNYSVSNRKQTKINKKHTRSVRRRKSQKRRRRQRSKSKRY